MGSVASSNAPAMYLAVVPAYRRECISLLVEAMPALEIYASDAHLDPSVKTGIDPSLYTKVRMFRLGSRGFIQSGSWLRAFKSPDLVIDLNPRSLTAWLLLLARKPFSSRRTVVWGHLHPQAGSSASTARLRLTMRRIADGTISYTYSNARDARESLPDKPVWVAANALYSKRQLEATPLSSSSRNAILYVGRLEPAKKVNLLLRAFAASGLSGESVRLKIAGTGSEMDHLRRLALELDIDPAVDFIGWVGDFEDVRRLYEHAICATSPGFAGLGLTQSFGFGVPVIVARDEPHSPEIELADVGGVEWFDSGDVQDFARAMREMYESRSAVPHAILADVVRERYSAETMAAGLAGALRSEGGQMGSTENSRETGRTGLAKPLVKVARRILRKIAINENVTFGRDLRVGRGVVVSSPHGLRIGNHVSIGPRSIIQVSGTIGDFSLIGMGVQIVGRDDHAVHEVGVPIAESTWVAERVASPRDEVAIGRDVWIGGSSVVMSGIRIGNGAIVGAGSVVTRDVEPYTIVAGNPARYVRDRFADDAEKAQHEAALDARK